MTDNKLEKYRLTDQLREKIAKHIFYELHPITDMFPDYWGITGTMDDESWRRLEKHCFYSADQVLSKLLPLLEDVKREGREEVKTWLLNNSCHIGRSERKYVFLGFDYIKQCQKWDLQAFQQGRKGE